MNNYEKALKKIAEDQKCKPAFCQGPTGPTGPAGKNLTILETYTSLDELKNKHPKGNVGDAYLVNGDLYIWSNEGNSWTNQGKLQGPTGPTGPSAVSAAYIVTFNNTNLQDGVPVISNKALPIERLELDTNNLITLDSQNKNLKFNIPGSYKISFKVSAYPLVESVDFDPNKDIVSIGFRQTNTDNVYVGTGQWVYNGEAIELTASGIISIIDPGTTYELANLSKNTIYLNTPSITNISSNSYFSNSLVTLTIEYLGN